MMLDARSISKDETLETDVCIVGAGIAGITLAQELANQDFRVCLLESGGLEPDARTQSLSWGENIGHPYYELDVARARSFGGSSHRWSIELGDEDLGVRLRPLEAIDFEERDWVPYSGWPFDKTHLDPFYERAQSVLKIGPYAYDVENWEDAAEASRLPFKSDRIQTIIFQFANRMIFIKDYRDELASAENVTTILHANVIEVETDDTAQTATRVRVATLDGNPFWVSARMFVLALGAIEIPRLLLLSNNVINTGLGNQHDLVGRFFMEHPHHWQGALIAAHQNLRELSPLYRVCRTAGVPIMGKIALSEDVLRREKLLNWCFSIHPRKKIPFRLRYPRIRSKDSVARALQKIRIEYDRVLDRIRPPGYSVFRLNQMAEQIPNPDSRVVLSDERDALGQRRANLNWQLSEIDYDSMLRSQAIAAEEFRRAGLGELHFLIDDAPPTSDIMGGWHHMGTTRMHIDAKKGVVDENNRVHSMANLFIAGPSVFPTGGYANPVLTTVALSIRLADHVKRVMREHAQVLSVST